MSLLIDTHKYNEAKVRYGFHLLLIVLNSFLFKLLELYNHCVARCNPTSFNEKTSVLPSEKIKNISTVQIPIPFIFVNSLIISSFCKVETL